MVAHFIRKRDTCERLMLERPRMWKGSDVYPDFGDGGAGRGRRWRRGGGGKEIPSIADLGEGGRWLVGPAGEVAWPSIFVLVYCFVMKES